MEPHSDQHQSHSGQFTFKFWIFTKLCEKRVCINLFIWKLKLDLMESISRLSWTICSDDSHHDRSLPFVSPEAVA